MEAVAHGIGVTNRFELFYDEDVDPIELLKQREEEKLKKKVEKTQKDKKPVKPTKATSVTAPKKPPVTAPVTPAVKDEVPKSRPRQNERPPRSNVNFQESREAEKNIRNKDDSFFNADRDGENRRGRGGFRGRGVRDRGRGFYNNTDNRPRRMFDRHSGSDKTGVRPTDKREGAGSNNWGDYRSDIAQVTEETRWDDSFENQPATTQVTNWNEDENAVVGKIGEGDEKPGNENLDSSETKENDQNAEQIEEPVKEMTLDEYKREQEAKKVIHKFNIRKPGEGEDQKQWKKAYVLKKKQDDEDEEDDDDEEEEEEDTGKKGPQKVLLDFQFNYSDSRHGMRGRGRGGRGGPRGAGRDTGIRDMPRDDRREGRGGRGGTRGKGMQQSAPRVDDFNDFPSLNTA